MSKAASSTLERELKSSCDSRRYYTQLSHILEAVLKLIEVLLGSIASCAETASFHKGMGTLLGKEGQVQSAAREGILKSPFLHCSILAFRRAYVANSKDQQDLSNDQV